MFSSCTDKLVYLRGLSANVFLVWLSLFLFSGNLLAANVSLAWSPPTTGPMPAGYYVFEGTSSNLSSSPVATVVGGNVTTATVSIPTTGTYYFALKSYDAAGNQSVPSNIVSATISSAAAQTITFGAPPSNCSANGTCSVSATASSGLPVTFSSQTSSVCTISGSTVTGVTVGTCTIAANQAGNASYSAAPQVAQSFSIAGKAQAITFGSAPSNCLVGGTCSVSATGGGSGNPVTFASQTSSVCTISGSTVTGVAVGTCTIAANQAGNASYSAANQVTQSFSIAGITQPLTANFTCTQTTGQLSISCKDTSTGGPTSWSWTFGDSTSSTLQNPSHTYSAPGTYPVKLQLTASISSTKNIVVSNNGLLAAYGFEDGSGLTVADSSGQGNQGTISGATWFSSAALVSAAPGHSKYGNALQFNGSTNLVTIPNSPSLALMPTSMTIEAWVYPTTSPTVAMSNSRTIVMKDAAVGAVFYLLRNDSATSPEAGITITQPSSTVPVPEVINSLPANAWTHLAVTYDGQIESLYVNGALASWTFQLGSIVPSTGALRIGGGSLGYFQGFIDEVRLYNRALTQAQVLNDLNTPISSGTSIFTTQLPAYTGTDGPYELGVKFQASKAANVSSIRYYRANGESGSHTGHIWSANGTLLASVVFSNETASGWQTANLANPLPITANTTYVVSVNSNTGYAVTDNALATRVTNGILSTVADGANCVYGTAGKFPTQSWNNSNYFRDVVVR